MDRRRFIGSAVAVAALSPGIAQAQGNDADVQFYLGSIAAVSDMMAWFMGEVGSLTTTGTESDYIDPSWQVDVLAPFAVARAAQAYMAGIGPPAAFSEAHALFADAIDESVLSGDAMKLGLLNADVAAITVAAEHMGNASDLITRASAALPTGNP